MLFKAAAVWLAGVRIDHPAPDVTRVTFPRRLARWVPTIARRVEQLERAEGHRVAALQGDGSHVVVINDGAGPASLVMLRVRR